MQEQKKIDYHLADQQLDDILSSKTKVSTLEEGMIFQLLDGSRPASNAMAESILGLTAEQIHGNLSASSWQFVDKNGTPLTEVNHPAMVALHTGKPCLNVIIGLSQPNTDFKWLLMNSQPLFLAHETSPYAVGSTFSDITQQEQEPIWGNFPAQDIVTQNIILNQNLNLSPKTADAEITKRLAKNETQFQKILDSNILGIVLAGFEKNISEALFRQRADSSATLICRSDTTNLCCYFNQP